ncbi:MAG: hypothetical protein MK180_13260 [Rhodobacteraceae bacterium]|nr:hypothetical protein [Paracoccaceae bacterium]
MSDTPNLQPAQGNAGRVVMIFIAVFAVGALLYVMSQGRQELRRSPTGLDGLRAWLVAQDEPVQNFTGGWPVDKEEVGLNILPIYDTNVTARRISPSTQEELLMQQDEFDIFLGSIEDKSREVTVMAVLPKWRSGMRLTGIAHPLLIAEPARIEDVLTDIIPGRDVSIRYSRTPFSEFVYNTLDGERLTAVSYAAQMFTAEACEPMIGDSDGMLLGRCDTRWGTKMLILSDPDLVNNHGLLLGDNAFIIRDFIAPFGAEGRILIDYSRRSWFSSPEERVARERDWADLLRFFEPPFTLMWAGAVLSLLLILWRAFMRFGPLRDSVGRLGAAKALAIGARANLMRLSGQDGALANEYARARLAATASALFGPAHARQFSNAEAFLSFTKRRHPDLAGPLAGALNNLAAMPKGASAGQAMAAVSELERILEQITDDSRGISRPSRRPQG